MALSFSFSKKKKSQNLEATDILGTSVNDANDEEESVEELTVVDKNQLQSKSSKSEAPLVIPMIARNTWRVSDTNDLNQLAKNALLKEAARARGELVDDESGEGDIQNGDVPMLFTNRVPHGYETDQKLDVTIRPDQAEEADYDAVPIEAMGLAMLRGMGWKEGQPIGASNARVVIPKIPELRPKGMGLGADRSVLQQLKKGTGGGGQNSGDSNAEQELTLKIGAYVYITSGTNRDKYGKLEAFDEDNGRAVICLTVGNKSVTVSQFALKVISKKEYDRDSKCINKSKYDEYKVVDEPRIIEDDPLAVTSNGKAEKVFKSKEKRKRSRSRSPVSRRAADSAPWIRPDLRVRLVDKRYMNGQYFNTKVVTIDDFSCRTDSGQLLENIDDSKLETVIPKGDHSCVMVVRGKFRGQLATVLKKDKKKAKASVEMCSSKQVKEISFDDICEFVGDMSLYE